MKFPQKICIIVFIAVFSAKAFAVSYLIDARACVNRLQWNSNFTRAECKMRNGRFTNDEGQNEISFTIPAGVGQTRVEVSIRPLRNGYILRLLASEPVSPKQIEPLLTWTLAISADRGIQAPEGICAKLLAEVQAVFE